MIPLQRSRIEKFLDYLYILNAPINLQHIFVLRFFRRFESNDWRRLKKERDSIRFIKGFKRRRKMECLWER